MTKAFYTFMMSILAMPVFGQDSLSVTAGAIAAEGKALYKLERASWQGTDILLEQHSDMTNIGGYFSYFDEGKIKNIFFSKALTPKVITTISFDTTTVADPKTDKTERAFSKTEEDIFIIRNRALLAIKEDNFFKTYDKTSLNLVPLMSAGSKKVFVLTAPKETGMMIFGNDYLLTFDDANNLTGKKKLHQNIIMGNTEGKKIAAGFHTHIAETGNFITSTDVCTVMLYEKMAGIEEYIVMSPNFCSIWNCEADELRILTQDDAKIYFQNKDIKKAKRKSHRE